ncbi:helix-turn-helix transcriptional regulator [Streptomyces sp. NPDC086549]|uniref:helix-turn-helix transcriptional regulator n=1 Tax=Streptomyces sp. NPDC086549 TaxID=3365752 RepID=UPI0038176450
MAVPETSDTDRTTGATRTAVLSAVRQAGKPLTVQHIAAELGLHANTVRFHLTRLVQARLMQEEQTGPSGPGRPRMVYSAVPAAPETEQSKDGYQFLAEILAGHLAATSPAPVDAAIAAGEEWGHYLADRPAPFSRQTAEESIEEVETLFERLGFAPSASEDRGTVLLRNCPFRAVADRRPSVVCSLHLGLMRGALAEMRAPFELTSLDRFDAPHPCIARLRPTDSGGPGKRQR